MASNAAAPARQSVLEAARYSQYSNCDSLTSSSALASVLVAVSDAVLAFRYAPEASVRGSGTDPAALRSVLDRLQRVDHIPHLFSAVTHP